MVARRSAELKTPRPAPHLADMIRPPIYNAVALSVVFAAIASFAMIFVA